MKTKNIAVGALAAVLTLALWWNFLLKPTRSEASKVKADTELQRAKLQPLQAQLDQANADAAHAGNFNAQLAALERAVPKSPALAAWIRDANAIAENSNIAWQSVTHGPPTIGATGVWSISIGIQIKGTYPAVIEYLNELAKLSRLVVADGVTLTTASDTGAASGAAPDAGASASTGPFTGGSQISATIAARMFETPPMVTDPVTGIQTPVVSTAPASGGTTGGTAGTSSSLQNS
jgi:Tfp pilus assembly protein PilO